MGHFRSAVVAATLFLAIELHGGICIADPPKVEAVPIDAAAIKLDPRLDARVTLTSRSSTLKDILSSVSTQTGIRVSIDDRDPASGYMLFACCNGVPAGALLDALYSLLSIRRGEWAWVRSGPPSAFAYSLHETPWAKNRVQIYNSITQNLLHNYVNVMRRLAPMKMDERKLHARELKSALCTDSDEDIAFYLTNGLFWTETRFFFGALADDQAESVLSGGRVTVDVSTLPEDVYEWYHQAYLFRDRKTINADGSETPIPEPKVISFYGTPPASSVWGVAPEVWITLGADAKSWMGTGSLKFGVLGAIKRAWTLAGDTTLDPPGDLIVKAVVETPEAEHERDAAEHEAAALNKSLRGNIPAAALDSMLAHTTESASTATRLEQASFGTGAPILAILDTANKQVFKSPVGNKLKDFLERIEGRAKPYMSKWRNRMLLVNYPFWFISPPSPISSSVLGSVKPDKSRRLNLEAWRGLMRRISDDQSEWLALQFSLDNVRQLRTCLRLCEQFPDVLTETGAEVGISGEGNLLSARMISRQAQSQEETCWVRLRFNGITGAGSSPREAYIEQRDDQLGWQMAGRFTMPTFRRLPGDTSNSGKRGRQPNSTKARL